MKYTILGVLGLFLLSIGDVYATDKYSDIISKVSEELAYTGEYIAIVDWDLPSQVPRFFVIEMKTGKIVHREFTSHGRASGDLTRASKFSNIPESHKSSLGVYRVSETYYGTHGYSVRLDGINKGINDNVRKRAIVLHPSKYVSDKYIQQNKFPGRSLGCLTLAPERSRLIIDKIKNGGLIINIFKGGL